MAYTQDDLDMVLRHIAEGEQHISNQEVIITKLRIRQLDTKAAEEALAVFNEMLRIHRHNCDVIAAGLEDDH